ncbi:alpha/beta-hydrolase [Corynespora cassiicola Philippines]|uniref:Alpha/beta-hydrolase n=1 Tax=Corynespora cassiicola Philippines TaxID=1448308 RepID=A0A2T2N807_CORCC|nr:alpha/beta-hydrolase [Corynespora cassiicola Philippines]
MAPRPTVVICPGAWATRQFFEPVVGALNAKGHPTIWDISTYAEHDPASFPPENLDANHLHEHVLKPLINKGEHVFLFMHSCGGIYGPSAVEGLSKKERTAKGLEGGVVALLWTAAFVARKGTSAMSAMAIDPANLPEWIRHDQSTNWVRMRKTHAKAMLFHDLPDEEADRLANALPSQPFSCFALPVPYDPYDDPNFRGSFAYILTDADRIIPYELQQEYVEIGGIKKTMVLGGSSHSPHLELPVQLVDHLVGLVNELTISAK